MFCTKCGKEILEGGKFCAYCGTAVLEVEASDTKTEDIKPEESVSEEPKPEEPVKSDDAKPEDINPENIETAEPDKEDIRSEEPEKKSNKGKIIAVVSASVAVIVCVAAIAVLFLHRMNLSNAMQAEEVTEEAYSGIDKPQESAADAPAEETPAASEYTAAAEETAQDSSDMEEPEQNQLFVCVPVDKMSLRETPGLKDDVIDELYPGTYLEWLGETAEDNEKYFYRVKVRGTDEEGYVNSDYCVKVLNEYDESRLNIVDTRSQVYSYDMMIRDIEKLTNEYRGILSYEIIGKSYAGNDIYAVTLGSRTAPNHVMVQAAIHGREYINTQVVMRMLEYYACYYDTASVNGRTYRELFENTAFHVIPMSNPDGVTISQYGVEALGDYELYNIAYNAYLEDSYYLVEKTDSNGYTDWGDHYKDDSFVRPYDARDITFEEYQRMWKANGRGVDLNNNFDADWYGIDLKQHPGYANYKGDYPVSEPEAQALVEYAKKYDFLCYLSYHSKGQLIYYDCEGNSDSMSDTENDYANKISSVIKYVTKNTKGAINVNLGGFSDWIQLSLHKPSVTIESGKAPCPVPIEEFNTIWLRHRELWASIADI